MRTAAIDVSKAGRFRGRFVMKLRGLVLATVMAVIVGLLLAACGSPPTPTPRPTATPRPEAMPAPTAMMLPTPTLRPGQPTPTPTPVPPGVTVAPTPTTAAVPTPTLDASFTAEWERLIAAAQEEGKLVIAGGGGVSDHRSHLQVLRGQIWGQGGPGKGLQHGARQQDPGRAVGGPVHGRRGALWRQLGQRAVHRQRHGPAHRSLDIPSRGDVRRTGSATAGGSPTIKSNTTS